MPLAIGSQSLLAPSAFNRPGVLRQPKLLYKNENILDRVHRKLHLRRSHSQMLVAFELAAALPCTRMR